MSLRQRLFGVLGAMVLITSACGGGGVETQETAVSIPETVPTAEPAAASLVVRTAEGGQLDFGTLEGRDVVLWFWAPW